MSPCLGLAAAGRCELLFAPFATGGIWLPSPYDVVYTDDAIIVTMTPNCVGVPERVSTPAVTDLVGWTYAGDGACPGSWVGARVMP